MSRIAVFGLGHIGASIKRRVHTTRPTWQVRGHDLRTGIDLTNRDAVRRALSQADAVIDCLPYMHNVLVAEEAADLGVAYFNLTEDIRNTAKMETLSSSAPIVPQCGLAPGMVSILAQQMTEGLSNVDQISIMVGALPRDPTLNRLGYGVTWSVDGLVNEYCGDAHAVLHGQLTTVRALDGYESGIAVNGASLEAAYTAGGIGTLAQSWEGRAQSVAYKTLRYPGHFPFFRILRDDLRMEEYKHQITRWLRDTLPQITDDVIYIRITVTGIPIGQTTLTTRTYTHAIYADAPGETAIQTSTACGALCVVDAYVQGAFNGKGFMRQETLPYAAIEASPFFAPYRV
jgi:saccharopine dehydrogenase-like NADP-dependent oxidoreductase